MQPKLLPHRLIPEHAGTAGIEQRDAAYSVFDEVAQITRRRLQMDGCADDVQMKKIHHHYDSVHKKTKLLKNFERLWKSGTS